MRILLALLPLAACSFLPDTLNYAGTITPLAGTCDPQAQATLTRRKSEIIFVPAAGTLTLRGHITGPSLTAGLSLSDPNKHPYQLAFQGTLEGKAVSGTYTTPRCRYAVALHLTGD